MKCTGFEMARIAAGAAVLCAASASLSPGGVIHVPGDAPTVPAALLLAAPGDTIAVAPGTYPGMVAVNKAVTILGPNAGLHGADPLRGPEAVFVPAVSRTDSGIVMALYATGITIDGIEINGDNASLAGGEPIGTADANAAWGISNVPPGFPAKQQERVRNCVIRNLTRAGVYFEGGGASNPASSGSEIERNLIDGVGSTLFDGAGVVVAYNFYAGIRQNVIRNAERGVAASFFYNPGSPAAIEDNDIEARDIGIWLNLYRQRLATPPPPFIPRRNRVTCSSADDGTTGLYVTSMFPGVTVGSEENRIQGFASGLRVWNTPTGAAMNFSRDTISACDTGAVITNYETPFGKGGGTVVSINAAVIEGDDPGATGLVVRDDHTADSSIALSMAGSTLVRAVGTGMLLQGSRLLVDPGDMRLSEVAAMFFRLGPNGGGALPGGELDATTCLMDGVSPGAMTRGELLALEDRVFHGTDLVGAGLVRTVPGVVVVTQNSGSINRGVTLAGAREAVVVGPGSFSEQVLVDSTRPGLSLKGANDEGQEPRAPESVLAGGFRISADSVAVDGFLIQDGYGTGGDRVGVDVASGLRGVVVRSTRLVDPGAGVSRGIQTGSGVQGLSVGGCTFDGWTSGIYLNPMPAGDPSEVRGSVFKGCVAGIGSDGINNLRITRNTFTGNDEGWGYSDIGSVGGNGLSADSNVFSGNRAGVMNYSPDMIPAEHNYWGTPYGPEDPVGIAEVPASPEPAAAAMVNALPLTARGDSVGENVDYYPWLLATGPASVVTAATGWNLVSVPRVVPDFAVDRVFPGYIGGFFWYDYTAQLYTTVSVLMNGAGYWAKFGEQAEYVFSGPSVDSISVDVPGQGWVLLGSLSQSRPLTDIVTVPAGQLTGIPLGFNAGTQAYEPASTIEPGRGYWVKVRQACRLILR